VANAVDSSDVAEVGWLVDGGDTVSLTAMLVMVLSAEIVLLSTKKKAKTHFLKGVIASIEPKIQLIKLDKQCTAFLNNQNKT